MGKAEIGLGVIGMGRANMASTLTLLEQEPDLRYRIRAICARRAEELECAARLFGVPAWTTDFRELVCRDDVDVVCVFSPDHLHAEHCIAALEQGKHVVCTKPMMGFGVYGTKGSLQAEFTDNEPGEIRVVLDRLPAHEPMTMAFEPERDLSAYGHGATVIRYMRHFQDCMDNDLQPSPGVLDGAKSVATGVAAWESVRTGQVAEVCDDF